MAFCPNCGAELRDGVKFCENCGAPVAAAETVVEQAVTEQPVYEQPVSEPVVVGNNPEQNSAFHDNFLDVDYDLSRVLFIATANTLDSIPRPLLDRMELIEMTGYLQEEKEEIAKKHLIPKELANHGLKASQLKLKKEILAHIIDDYTRESGVRSLERQIATICRKVDTKIALGEEYNPTVTLEDLRNYLGQARFSRDSWETNKYVGVVTGLAWTQVGGEILFIETSLSAAKRTRHQARCIRENSGTYPCAGRSYSKGWPECGNHDDYGTCERFYEAIGQTKNRDDGRDDAARESASYRRRERKTARGETSRYHGYHPLRGQPERRCGDQRDLPQGAEAAFRARYQRGYRKSAYKISAFLFMV